MSRPDAHPRLMTTTDHLRGTAQRYADAWAADDLDGILACYHPDFTLHYFGHSPYAGDHVGRDAAVATMLEVGAKAPWRLDEIEEVLAGPTSAIVVARLHIDVDGTTHPIRRLLRFRVTDGQFTDCWLYDEDQALVDRGWSS